MEGSARLLRRAATARVAVHSLHRFVFTVPDLDAAAAFYADFGLDVRRRADAVDLLHLRLTNIAGARSIEKPGPKRLQYVSFGAFRGRLRPDRGAPQSARRRDDQAASAWPTRTGRGSSIPTARRCSSSSRAR